MTAVERELQRQQDQIKRFGAMEDSLTAMADARDILEAAMQDQWSANAKAQDIVRLVHAIAEMNDRMAFITGTPNRDRYEYLYGAPQWE